MAGATRQVTQAWQSGHWHYVFCTDIRGYYRNIPKRAVERLLKTHIADHVLRDLCLQWLHYSMPDHGTCRGSALSPLIDGSLLWDINNDFSKRGELFYAWYMDDFIIFTRTRWHARRAIKRLLNALTREGV